jgi:hypothetical protein
MSWPVSNAACDCVERVRTRDAAQLESGAKSPKISGLALPLPKHHAVPSRNAGASRRHRHVLDAALSDRTESNRARVRPVGEDMRDISLRPLFRQ